MNTRILFSVIAALFLLAAGHGTAVAEPWRNSNDDQPRFRHRPDHPVFGEGYRRPGGWNRERYDYGFDRQFEDRIRDGVRTGRLSSREVAGLEDERRELERRRSAYWADGHLSSRERDELRDGSRDISEKLEHELNDGERRESRRWSWWSW